MGILSLLGFSVGGGGDNTSGFTKFMTQIQDPINTAMLVMLGLIGAGAIVFAIWVGFRLAKAEDEGKRKEAKQQLMWSIIAIAAVAVMFVLFTTLFHPTNGVFGGVDKTTVNGKVSLIANAGNQVMNVIHLATRSILQLFSLAAMLYAIYVGMRLAMAQDEGKRKEAKAQLLWSLIAVVGALALAMIISMVMSAIAPGIGQTTF